jgi:hypothetical protein
MSSSPNAASLSVSSSIPGSWYKTAISIKEFKFCRIQTMEKCGVEWRSD